MVDESWVFQFEFEEGFVFVDFGEQGDVILEIAYVVFNLSYQ